MPRQQSEASFQRQVLQLAKLLRWRVYHTRYSIGSHSGYPDLTLVRDRVLWAELKSETGTLTPDQSHWIEALRAGGAEVYVWRPRDLEAIREVLR